MWNQPDIILITILLTVALVISGYQVRNRDTY
jgi:hypothetical protein